MNILIIHNRYKLAGGEDTVMENEGNLLKEHGHNVYYYVRDNKEITEMNLLKKAGAFFGTVYSFRAYRDVEKLIKENKIDVVHIHNTVPLVSWSVYSAAKKYGCKLVQSVHNMRLLCPSALMIRDNRVCEDCLKKGLKCAAIHGCYKDSRLYSAALAFALWFHRKTGSFKKVDAYLYTTEFNRKLLSRVIPEDKLFYKPYYSDAKVKDPEGKKRDYYIYISRLEYLKGIQVALEAFKKLPEHKLLVLGVGPDEERSRRYVEDNHMENVTFLGFKNKAEMTELLYNAKALVFPTQWYEGFPMTIVESLACGTPVIGSDIGNVGTIVKDGINGLRFRYDDSNDLVEKIRYFEEHPAEVKKMESGAIKDFNDNHTPEAVYEMTMRIYW
ncbi:MAG: glycosyltransferase family 4 protein [Lachnospiraceae bacterium]|nr:glycosyltransferase family 4 protein [Lachnospiraceae bacterium]